MRYFGIFASIRYLLSCVKLVKVLNRSNWELEAQRMEDLVRSHGRVVIGVNASSLFSNVEHVDSAPSFRGWYGRLQGIRMSSFALRHSFQVIKGNNDSPSAAHPHVDFRGKSMTRLGSFLRLVRLQANPEWVAYLVRLNTSILRD
jgi:hypothetical protein